MIFPVLRGVSLVSPKGIDKDTAVRSLMDILPKVESFQCNSDCLLEDIKAGDFYTVW